MKPRLWFWVPAVLGLVADLVSKHYVFATLSRHPDQRVEVFGSWLVLCLQQNRGGVFGILQGKGYIFIALTVVALGVVVWMLRQAQAQQRLVPLALGLMVAGALGNLYDRLFIGHVRDFIYVEAIRYPAFNIADTCICIAAGLLILGVFREPAKTDGADESPAAAA
ncbi:MAG: signal peptidase II [Candidatus Brocadiae bacterium]|nr:signal peptidase II [Candidatus Brocadiia bacterium]